MLRVWPRFILTKKQAYLFESGWDSLTRRIMAIGYEPQVVSRIDSYPVDMWQKAGVYRSYNQADLMVEDNQTREYENPRKRLEAAAWGI